MVEKRLWSKCERLTLDRTMVLWMPLSLTLMVICLSDRSVLMNGGWIFTWGFFLGSSMYLEENEQQVWKIKIVTLEFSNTPAISGTTSEILKGTASTSSLFVECFWTFQFTPENAAQGTFNTLNDPVWLVPHDLIPTFQSQLPDRKTAFKWVLQVFHY